MVVNVSLLELFSLLRETDVFLTQDQRDYYSVNIYPSELSL